VKLFLSLVLCFSAFFCTAQAKGSAAVELGYLPESTMRTDRPYSWTDNKDTLYADISVKLPILRYFFVNGGVETYMLPAGSGVLPVYFSPMCSGYTFGFGATLGGLTVGMGHECTHPDKPNNEQLIFGDAAYTKFYARYEMTF
jgi:hypothetical protein